MSTQILAPGTSQANSSEIIVITGYPINVGAFRADGAALDAGFRGSILRKDVNGIFNVTNYYLEAATPNQMIVGPGIYKVLRSGTFATATGIQID
jgi:hypothetical protein